VDENVKVEERQISVPTAAPTPCLLGSPAWTDLVCGPQFCVLVFFMVLELLVFQAIPASAILAQVAQVMFQSKYADDVRN
jgi:hypothetical protein